MKLEGSYQFDAPPAIVWESLMDPAVLTQALPGGEQLEETGENEYRAAMNVRVGPVQGKFQGSIAVTDVMLLESYRMTVSGQGAPGFVSGEGKLRLEEIDSGTLLHYSGDVQIGGRIAGVSQRLIDSTAKSLTCQGLQALDQQILARLSPAAATVSSSPPAAMPSAPAAQATATTGPSSSNIAAAVARDVAMDLALDYVPLQQQEKLFYGVLGALGMLLFVVLVRLVQRR